MPNQKSSSALHRLFGPDAGGKVILFAGCDQVGTPKIFVRAGKDSMEGGTLCKKIFYDSFGNAQHDSEPQLFMPIGFAGGLYDRDTGLVRFGYRDYDPKTGRFTAPDPAKDLRGDGDLYDYCVDDPVSRVDPAGLAALPALPGFLAVMGGAGAVGVGVPYGISAVIGPEGKAKMDKVAPVAAKTIAAGATPGAAIGLELIQRAKNKN